ncbi:MAG: NAD(P)/FAD-dependent oxidoreductase [archaeon]
MISIIGAGPVGSHAAYLLARKGYDVHVYEEHTKIGRPVQCTGIVTSEIAKIVDVKKEFLVNTVNLARIYSPNGKFIEVKLSKPNLIIDREKFDKYLAAKAKKAGAKIHLGKKFEGIRNGKIMVSGEEIKTDYLIGADGPNSLVSKSICDSKGKKVVGIQARVKKKIDPNVVEFWLGLGEFAWLVPESNSVARVGLADSRNVKEQFEKLLKKVGGKVLEKQGGIIPIYDSARRIQKGRVMTIGDAAGQVKATTYGGLVPGLIAATELGKSIDNYENNCNKRLKKELWLGMMMRKVLNKFSNEDYNQLVGYFTQNKIKKVLEEEDRDFPSRFLFKIIMKEPRLLKFATKLI